MRKLVLIAAAMLVSPVFAPRPAIAMDDRPTPAPSAELQAGRKAIEAKDWTSAIKWLSAAERADSRNADVQNLLGFAHRNSGQLDAAFKYYERALQLDPRHLGAHEYVGEAYLMANNLPKAEEHLAALKRYCARMCEERDDLEKKIAEYRARTAATK